MAKKKIVKQGNQVSYTSIPLEEDMGFLKREAYYYAVSDYLDLKTLKDSLETKADKTTATRTSNGLMSSSDKVKLDQIDPNKEYIHPTTDGHRHLPINGTTNGGKFVKAGNSPGESSWENIQWSDITVRPTTLQGYGITDASKVGHTHNDYALVNHTHPKATNVADGLLSKEDKQKLDSIQMGAANQNTFANFKVNSTIISADTVQDTLEITAGTGINLLADDNLDRITIEASGFASEGHNHDSRYAKVDHTHSYASVNHNHDDVYVKSSGANFTGEVSVESLVIGGRRIFIQPTTPSMSSDGDIWLKF